MERVMETARKNKKIGIVIMNFYAQLPFDPQSDSQVFIYACQVGNLDVVQAMVMLNADGRYEYDACDNMAIKLACYYGHLDVVKFLAEALKVDVSVNQDVPLRYAARAGHTDICEYLLTFPHVSCVSVNFDPYRQAKRFGHERTAEMLLAAQKRQRGDRS